MLVYGIEIKYSENKKKEKKRLKVVELLREWNETKKNIYCENCENLFVYGTDNNMFTTFFAAKTIILFLLSASS